MEKTLRILIAATMLTTGGAIIVSTHNATTPVAGAHHFTPVGGHWAG